MRAHTRIDRLSAILIDAVLQNYTLRDIAAAAQVLARHQIAIQVALRVLTQPSMRRRIRRVDTD